MKRLLPLALLGLIALAPAAAANDLKAAAADDEAAVRTAVLDYVEGVYTVDPSRIERSVHPELAKRGYARRSIEESYRELKMTFDELVELSKKWNADGSRADESSAKEVIVYEVLDQTASVKLVATWGIDYMHLAKYDGKWKIVNVLWQLHPPKG